MALRSRLRILRGGSTEAPDHKTHNCAEHRPLQLPDLFAIAPGSATQLHSDDHRKRDQRGCSDGSTTLNQPSRDTMGQTRPFGLQRVFRHGDLGSHTEHQPGGSGPVCVKPLPFSLAAGFGAADSDTSTIHDNWEVLDLPHLLVGECNLAPHPQRLHVAEVGTTNNDQPRLADLLQQANQRIERDWLLLCSPDLNFAADLCTNLPQLCRPDAPPRLISGRAWSLPAQQKHISSHHPDLIAEAIHTKAKLDPIEQPAWALIPRGYLQQAPLHISCEPHQMFPRLREAASQLGWPHLDATAIVSCLRERSRPAPAGLGASTAVVLPHQPGAPRLSLLLAAPEHELEALSKLLLPTEQLPWEVIARPEDVGLWVAWSDALSAAQGELCWPVTPPLPPLALLPRLLDCFESPGIEFVQLAWSLNGAIRPENDPYHQEPGCLVGHTAWWRRLLPAVPADINANQTLLRLRQTAEQRGANIYHLPMVARSR